MVYIFHQIVRSIFHALSLSAGWNSENELNVPNRTGKQTDRQEYPMDDQAGSTGERGFEYYFQTTDERIVRLLLAGFPHLCETDRYLLIVVTRRRSDRSCRKRFPQTR